VANRSKAKGTAGETAIVNYLLEEGLHAYRKVLSGSLDKGDISVLEGRVTIEAKNASTTKLSEYVDEATTEALNAKSDFGVAWHKRTRKGNPKDWYVTMTGETFVRMLKAIK